MSWIKFDKATSDKPEVFAMASALRIDPDAVVGKLLRVWGWFDEHTTDGNAANVTSALLDRQAGLSGFADAMLVVGWLTEELGTLSLTNFDRHNGETAKARALTAKRVATHRGKSNAGSVTHALPREEKSISKPLNPLKEGDLDLNSALVSDPATPRLRRRSPERRKATAIDELGEVEREMEEIVRPGGCAYNVAPVGAKKTRFEKLGKQRDRLLVVIKAASKELAEVEVD